MKHFSYFDIGQRDEQQDSIWVGQSNGASLYLVADGVGGQSGGKLASEAVVRAAEAAWDSADWEKTSGREFLENLGRSAHDAIVEAGERSGVQARSTVVALLILEGAAHWIHSGDSRLYHFRNGRFIERTIDHSVVQILASRGEIAEEEMGSHPDQGRLLQSLGGSEFEPPQYRAIELEAEPDEFLLCSDGFWEHVGPEEIASLFASEINEPSRAQALLDEFGRSATARAAEKADNISVLLVRNERTLASPSASAMPAGVAPALVNAGGQLSSETPPPLEDSVSDFGSSDSLGPSAAGASPEKKPKRTFAKWLILPACLGAGCLGLIGGALLVFFLLTGMNSDSGEESMNSSGRHGIYGGGAYEECRPRWWSWWSRRSDECFYYGERYRM
ncbi:MAG: PP2C family serine/threonine-protein phosphatase [Verrucomicrobiota bacterium]